MTPYNNPPDLRLFALVDAAACPAKVQPLLEESGTTFKSVFAGLPEEALGPASLFIVEINDRDAGWVVELDRIDLHSPCLSVIWSRVGLEDMATHLRAFLFADIGDGMRGMVRFFDPRNTGAVFKVWGEQICAMFMAPVDRWLYRGHHEDWQQIENVASAEGRICKSILVQLQQGDLDALGEHTEPDELLASLIQLGVVDESGPYLDRYVDFLARYQRALGWGLSDPADRLNFCRHTYVYGVDFDRHVAVQPALAERATTGEGYAAVMGRIPSRVWDELANEHEARVAADQAIANAQALGDEIGGQRA